MRQQVELGTDPVPVEWMPFTFHRWADGSVLVTNLVGEHEFLTPAEFSELTSGQPVPAPLARRLRAKHIVRTHGEQLPVDLLALKYRTQHHRLAEFTSLHMFVVTLRCEHTCRYCQVSRQTVDKAQFDMTRATADRALDVVFRSPSRNIKIEFQGGEPLLNLDLIRYVVTQAEARNQAEKRNLSFVIASNLALLTDDMLAFAAEHRIDFSTSLDGPADLHTRNRPRPGGDSWQRTIDGVARIRSQLGPGRVSALMTTTQASLLRVRDIIDSYVEQGFDEIFLRPVSPYGNAVRLHRRIGYDTSAWIAFYREGLEHILSLNAGGVPIRETFASIVLNKMLSNSDTGYVDLTSPAGIGIKALLYNYDGDVYASDEARMLAEMGDRTYRLGSLEHDSYDDIVHAETLLDALEESFTLSAPRCTDCAFERFCGADPLFHHTTFGNPVGRKAESAFCQRNMAVFTLLLDTYRHDSAARQIFQSWARP